LGVYYGEAVVDLATIREAAKGMGNKDIASSYLSQCELLRATFALSSPKLEQVPGHKQHTMYHNITLQAAFFIDSLSLYLLF